MPTSRRLFCAQILAAAAAAGCATTAPADSGPQLWLLERGPAKVFILGFADAEDRTWLTPRIEAALRSSAELWVETPPPGGPPNDPVLIERLGYDRSARLSEFLGPDLGGRVLALADKAGVARERIEPMRPWLAHYVLVSARAAKRGTTPIAGDPQTVAFEIAKAAAIPVRSEYATGDDLIRFFAAMPDEAQRQYLRNLMDFIDADDAGLTRSYSWAKGRPDDTWAMRMHGDTPALYRQMHTLRNQAWARRIDGFLGEPKTRFLLVGQNHVLGPDSILAELRRTGMRPRLQG